MPPSLVLSLYWFAMLAALGTFFPLFSLYLSDNLGLSGLETGLITAALPLAGMVAQPLWGAFADRSGSRVRILTLVTAGAGAGYFHLSTQRGFA
ncbi:MAG: MFS transporter, partial [Candidatus Binatia bacterium]